MLPAVASARSTSAETAEEKAARKAARAARLQKRRGELELDLASEDEQESQAWWDVEQDTELGAAVELLDAALTREDADFDGSEAEWQQLDHDLQLERVLDAVERRRSGLDKWTRSRPLRQSARGSSWAC